jgi:hypothetical protein
LFTFKVFYRALEQETFFYSETLKLNVLYVGVHDQVLIPGKGRAFLTATISGLAMGLTEHPIQ